MLMPLIALSFAGAAGDSTLISIGPNLDMAGIAASDARVSVVRTRQARALRVETGHAQPWPGITVRAPEGRWDLTRHTHVALELANAGSNAVTVFCRVDNPGADGVKNCVTGNLTLQPGSSGKLSVALPRNMWASETPKLFGMRGYPNSGGLDLSNVVGLVIFVAQPKQDHAFDIISVRATGAYTGPPPTVSNRPFLPFIDTFGQYIHRDWPGKTQSFLDLRDERDDESAALRRSRGPREWNRYGGWAAGPQLRSTGAFRAEKHAGKWWLVDPEGRLFWSHGVDCVGMLDTTPVDERAEWFADLPGRSNDMREFAGTGYALHGHYAGKSPNCFCFAGANLKRKYGDDWRERNADTAHLRLRAWGMNTIGNWSDSRIYSQRRTPYVATLHTGGKMIEGSAGYWGKFPDVFDPAFRAETVRKMAELARNSGDDPWCIGYFVDNEMSWGDSLSLAEGALQSPPDQAAKLAFIADLKAKYGEIGKLNDAWGASHGSWDALLSSRSAPDRTKAEADLGAFYSRLADTYFRTVRDALKSVAPNRLYLGCRFAWANERAVAAAVKHCDVVSYNIYQRSGADFRLPVAADVPLIVGEFHFGALDRGMFHTGLVPVQDQRERARAYREYVRGLLRHPQFVGCHWFQWQDEPTTGRVYDEENYQIGLVDICDTPYPETVAAVRDVGSGMYRYRAAP